MTSRRRLRNINADLDKAILKIIKGGRNFCREIFFGIDVDYRTLDRRLQALRKRGVITYSHKYGWTLLDAVKREV